MSSKNTLPLRREVLFFLASPFYEPGEFGPPFTSDSAVAADSIAFVFEAVQPMADTIHNTHLRCVPVRIVPVSNVELVAQNGDIAVNVGVYDGVGTLIGRGITVCFR